MKLTTKKPKQMKGLTVTDPKEQAVAPVPVRPAKNLLRPWSRLDNENDTAFAAFAEYLKMPLKDRSDSEVARRIGVSQVMVSKYHRDFDWDLRIIAYDRWCQAQTDEDTAAALRLAAQENREILSEAKSLLYRDVLAYAKKAKALPDDQPSMSVGQFTKLLEAVVTMERLNNEQATQIRGGSTEDRKLIRQEIVHVLQDGQKKKDVSINSATGNIVIDVTPEKDSNGEQGQILRKEDKGAPGNGPAPGDGRTDERGAGDNAGEPEAATEANERAGGGSA